MDTIIVNEAIKLVPYFENYDTTLKWYEDKDVCKQVDNIDFVYDIDRLQKMYNYLNTNFKRRTCRFFCFKKLLNYFKTFQLIIILIFLMQHRNIQYRIIALYDIVFYNRDEVRI